MQRRSGSAAKQLKSRLTGAAVFTTQMNLNDVFGTAARSSVGLALGTVQHGHNLCAAPHGGHRRCAVSHHRSPDPGARPPFATGPPHSPGCRTVGLAASPVGALGCVVRSCVMGGASSAVEAQLPDSSPNRLPPRARSPTHVR
ncbi:hypothetical protein GN956_G15615 [Arapaima gigas]